MTNLERINHEQRLYVIKCGEHGYTCLGFDVALRRTAAVAEYVGRDDLWPVAEPGTPAAHAEYVRALKAGAEHAERTGTYCKGELTGQLIGLEGRRVEVVDAYGQKRRFQVGKSCGWMPCHVELANVRSTGGGAVTGAPFKSLRVIR